MPYCHLHALPYHTSPCARFALISQVPGAVLLDCGQPQSRRGRYDLMSAWPLAELAPSPGESANDFARRLRHVLEGLGKAEPPAGTDLPFIGGLIGYLAYDFGRRVETMPTRAFDDLHVPDAGLGLYAWALITDHQTLTSQLLFHPSLEDTERQRLIALFDSLDAPRTTAFHLRSPFSADLTETQYRASVERAQAYIQAGDCYQVNVTQRFQAPCEGDPWAAYLALRAACPTPFAGYRTLANGGAILSFSPERFIKASAGQVETRPIKGTRARGRTPEEDRAQADELLASSKDRAENLMIVDLLRNDLGRSCAIGSVRVPELFTLESYPNVHHLVSSITGRLAADRDALDLIIGSFPGGSITGAPKIRAMQIIDELEPTRRSIYCGSLLYLDVRGELDSSIAIRTLLIKDGQASCWGGGGIVSDSDWQEEYRESITKVQMLMQVLEDL